MQQTLNDTITLKGKGLHTGETVTLTIMPALAEEGIIFVRQDVTDRDNVIPALWDHVEASQLCTLLKNDDGVSVSTIEHLMAAFSGMGIDNALVMVDGPEVPIMDGSAMPFIRAIAEAGLRRQPGAARKALRILKEVEIRDDMGRVARLSPDVASIIDYTIEFEGTAIGRQSYTFELMEPQDFITQIAECRTFTRLQDVEMLMKAGLIKGGGLDNAVVIDGDKVVNPEGMRRADEPVRHKVLDAVGDLYLAGGPIIGRFTCEKGGHALTNQLLRELFATSGVYVWTTDHLGIGQNGNMSSTEKLAYNA